MNVFNEILPLGDTELQEKHMHIGEQLTMYAQPLLESLIIISLRLYSLCSLNSKFPVETTDRGHIRPVRSRRPWASCDLGLQNVLHHPSTAQK